MDADDPEFTVAVTAASWVPAQKPDDAEPALAAAAPEQAADTLAAIAVLRTNRKNALKKEDRSAANEGKDDPEASERA